MYNIKSFNITYILQYIGRFFFGFGKNDGWTRKNCVIGY